jgi:hypothetical protein
MTAKSARMGLNRMSAAMADTTAQVRTLLIAAIQTRPDVEGDTDPQV